MRPFRILSVLLLIIMLLIIWLSGYEYTTNDLLGLIIGLGLIHIALPR
jgi:hypothetical protein